MFKFVTACHKNPKAESALADEILRYKADNGSILVWFSVGLEDYMYGIIIWLSSRGQSALIVTDGGTNLAFGHSRAKASIPLAVGDLIFAHGLRPDQDEFTAGLASVIRGFWPDIAQTINKSGAAIPCRMLSKSGNIARGLVHIACDNLTAAPHICADGPALTAIK
jgi:hypothetical protein